MHPVINFLETSDWRNAVAIVAILATIVLGITTYRLNRKRRKLVYEFLSMTRLVGVRDALAGRIRLLVDGVEARDVGLVTIRIENSGTEPIKASEFLRPISFNIDPMARIIEAEISQTRPPGIGAQIDKEDQKATLRPLLLNAKDSVTVKLIIANFNGHIRHDARIEGVELTPKVSLGVKMQAQPFATATSYALELLTFTALGMLGLGVTKEDFPNDYRDK